MKKYIYPAIFIKEEDGYLTFYHYDDAQLEYLQFNQFFYDRGRFSSAVCFCCDKKVLNLRYVSCYNIRVEFGRSAATSWL